MTAKNEVAKVAKVETFELPILTEEVREAMEEELDGMNLSFGRVKMPSGGGLTFELPGEDENNPEIVTEIVGVIVDKHPLNGCWLEKYNGQNNPPDCSALDGKNGIGNPGGHCAECPYNQWGSGTDDEGNSTKGKKCKNMYRIYIQREGEMFPLLITLPPTSLGNLTNYVARRLLPRNLRSYGAITRISLKKATSNNGITYSQAVFSFAGKLGNEQVVQMKAYSKELKKMTRSVEILSDEYTEAPIKDGNNVPF